VCKRITLRIPAGVGTGSRLRLAGKGEAGAQGGAAGDLYVVLHVKEHGLFHRQEDDLICEVPVAADLAALGGEIEVPTLNGTTTLKIPPSTPSGKTFQIRGRGITKLGSNQRGDQVVGVYIDVPKKLTDRQKELLQEFAKISGENVEAAKGFTGKLKDLFAG